MATRTSLNENDHIQFLLSCVRHSKNGQVDFDAVTKECQIISKGAAAKRLARLSKRFPTAAGGHQQPRPATTHAIKNSSSATAIAKQKSGGIPKRFADSGLANRGRNGKAGSTAKDTAEHIAAASVAETGSDKDTLLDEPTIKTEKPHGDGCYDALVDPAGFYESDA